MLHLFKDRGIVRSKTPAGGSSSSTAEATPDDLERMARVFRERDEHDRLKQHRMVEYAELRACRWDYLVNYFGKDDVESDSCGHCDRCAQRHESRAPIGLEWRMARGRSKSAPSTPCTIRQSGFRRP